MLYERTAILSSLLKWAGLQTSTGLSRAGRTLEFLFAQTFCHEIGLFDTTNGLKGRL
jgi:hypothetical protein